MASLADRARQAQAQNIAIRQIVLASAQDMKQAIYTGTIVPATNGNVINVPLRQVGLVKGFIVEVDLAVTNTGTGTAALTDFNAANALSNISFFDLDNYQRINTTGWHLNLLNTTKEGFPFGAAILNASMQSPVKYGNNFDVMTATASLAQDASGSVKMRYWVPLAYNKSDLRGSVYMGVVNATAYLQLTINPTPSVTTGDAVAAIYSGANTNVRIDSAAVTVYQCYLDQLPRWQAGQGNQPAGAPMLPPLDVATQYRLFNTTLTGVAPGQDFPVPFSNFQDFLSLSLIYNRGGTLAAGTDLNYFALAAANTLQLFKVAPRTQALMERVRNRVDYPLGSYVFDFRDAPVSTNQTGNMQLLLNAITAPSDAKVMVGFESFAMVNAVLGAASLPAG
jgi:hypothetical protein